MDGFEWNKIFAAVLVAGILASGSGFIASKAVKPKDVAAHGSTEVTEATAAAPQLPEPVLALIATADVERGKTLSKACAACHSFEKGGPDGVGPHLWNVINRGKAAADGFSYSEGLKAMGGKWTYAGLNKFLWKPKSYVSDTKMVYAGMKKPEDRAALIAYLRMIEDSAPPLPSAAEIAAEEAELAPPPAVETPATEQPATAPSGDSEAPAKAAH